MQFIKVSFTFHATNKIKNSIKSRRNYSAIKRKYDDNPEPQNEYIKKES